MVMLDYWFVFKCFIHFIYVFVTGLLGFRHTYHLSFTKESDGCWYIDFPNWPFEHGNLMMVAGADTLCDELDNGTGHVKVKVVTSNWKINSFVGDVIRCDRVWSYLRWGGQYIIQSFNNSKTKDLWLCQVTLFVIGWWPKYIYIRKENDS